jgi:hypothetical protein
MQKVLDQYAAHGLRIMARAQGRKLTHSELKGLAYYRAAFVAVERLIAQ